MAEIELLPCPFCGSDDVRLNQVTTDGGWGVICRSCHTYQDTRSEEATATATWNTRPLSATLPSEGLEVVAWECSDLIMTGSVSVITDVDHAAMRKLQPQAWAVEELVRLSQAQAALAGMKGERDAFELGYEAQKGKSVSFLRQIQDDLTPRLEAAESEVKRLTEEKEGLRQVISECAASLMNGAAIATEASLDFMKLLPAEIQEAILGHKARIKALEEALRPFARIADMEDRAEDGASVMVNVSRCRDARSTLQSERSNG